MSPALALAALLAGPGNAAMPAAKPKPVGVLILAYGASGAWRKDLGSLRTALKGHAVESVEGAAEGLATQKALDRLQRQRVDKIVAIPLETLSESPLLEQTRYLFGVREDQPVDRPDAAKAFSGGGAKSGLKTAPSNRGKRLQSRAELVLAPAMDRSTILVDILADRAKALARSPAQECLLLVGIAPRSDDELKAWRVAADTVAEQVRAKAGFKKAAAVWVRDGVRSDQRDEDRAHLKKVLRELVTEGRGKVVAVPLTPDGSRPERLLREAASGLAYRWDGKGVLGDARLLTWIQSSVAASAKLPDSRNYRDGASFGAPRPLGGSR